MDLEDVLKNIRFKASGNISGITIGKVTDDSRAVAKGDAFVAVRGYSQDGAKFIDSAIAKGAKAIIAQNDFAAPGDVAKILVGDVSSALPAIAANFYGHPSGKLKTVGITGTNGKTTITYLIESILKASGKTAGVIGTINYRMNDRVTRAKNTTPGSLQLQSILADMVKEGIGYAIMEVSSHALDQRRIDCILFDTAIFTNITSDHLDYHKTAESYFAAKRTLFAYLKKNSAAILNNDDSKVASLANTLTGNVITYGLKKKSDLMAEDVALSLNGSSFTVRTPEDSFKVNSSLIGAHNVSNILAGVGAARTLGIDTDFIIRGIETLGSVPGRCEPVQAGQDFKVFVDYAHTEDALCNVLGLLKKVAGRKIITVFGCGGDRDKTKRPLMGKAACRFSGHVIITSDNPRSEEPAAIILDIEEGIKGKFSNYEIVPDRRAAIERAVSLAKKDDIVLIAGKGHEDYQIIKDKTIHFDDREVAKEILESLGCRV